MKYQFFTIPVCNAHEAQRELNQFCQSHRIASVEKLFVADGDRSFWTLYLPKCERNRLLRISYISGYTEVKQAKRKTLHSEEKSMGTRFSLRYDRRK